MKYSMCLSASPAKFEAVPFTGSFEKNLRLISGMGFDGVELAVRNPKETDLDALLGCLEAEGLSVPAIGTGQAWGEEGLSFTDPDREIRKQAVERAVSHLPFARQTGAAVIIGLLRGILTPGTDPVQAHEWMYDAFSRCCDEALKYGVRIAFEPINRYETSLLNGAEEGLEFIEQVGSSNLGMLLDTFHMNIEEPSIEGSIRLAGEKIFHFHYADSNRNYPGSGHLDFASILTALKDTGYTGFLSGEHRSYPDGETAARKGIEYLKSLGIE